MHMWGNGWGMGWMWLWWILGIAFVIAIVWILTAAARRSSGSSEDSPEQILKRRYARGEINHEEYEQKLNELRK